MKTILIILVTLITSSMAMAETRAPKLYCGGTEPFWDVRVTQDQVVYKSAEVEAPVVYQNLVVTDGLGMTSGLAFKVNATNSDGDPIRLDIVKATSKGCNDGMSPTKHKYHITINTNGLELNGCCDNAR